MSKIRPAPGRAICAVGLLAPLSLLPAACGEEAASADGGDLDRYSRDHAPALLSETGLYVDIAAGEVVPEARPYAPRFPLWSYGSEKDRWLLLPEGAEIDTSDADAWVFPVGTKVWKEFTRDGVRVETRLLWKRSEAGEDAGAPHDGWVKMAYVWNADGTDADAAPDGSPDAAGTAHDVPATEACGTCHRGLPDRLLGVGAIQLAGDGDADGDGAPDGLTLVDLESEGRLSDPLPAALDPPGDDTARAALGYLHANCGICHNGLGTGANFLDLRLWLETDALVAVESTAAYATAVGQTAAADPPLANTAATLLVSPGDPASSLLTIRMSRRGPKTGQMPPLASESPDPAGLALVEAWISSLP